VTFDEILAQVLDLLQREGRVSYRALKIRFHLDDEYLEGLKDELIVAKRLAVDEDGKVLVWVGASPVSSSKFQVSSSQSPTPSPRHSGAGLRTPDAGLASAERRQLTVMFCDLVGSTALSEQLDPEELREVVRAYQAMCAEVIGRFDGHLAKYLGDGLLVYFGYPVAHEDDAQRAVRTGLDILAALPQLNARLQPILEAHSRAPLQVRIGIHTGLVVAGEMGAGDTREPLAIVGETPNIAARLQEIAKPNTVVLSAATQRLVQGLFTCQDLGLQALKGVSAPLEVYRVLGESGVRSRLEVAETSGLTPLVGREEEVGLLLQRWEQVKEGSGQVVLLSGEPGIGKSRLVQVLKERVAGEAQTWLECRCLPYYQNTALYPVIDLLQQVLGFQRDDTPEEKLRKLEVGAQHAAPLQADTIPLLATLLSLPHPDGYPPLTLTPQRQKQKTLEALLAWLLAEAERQPLPFIVEDPHWADPSTLEFLGLLVDQVPTARILSVLAFRPEFTPPWTPRSHVTQLTLTRLPRKQVEVMVEKVARGKVLPPEMVQQIAAKTDGVPLFVEELTKAVLESGLQVGAHSRAPSFSIPTTLHDSLMARLDRLGTAKEVAQLGATLGREFSYELLQAVSPMDETSLQQALAKLIEAEVLYQRGLSPQARYLFKHALIQDAAYQSLLKSTRQQYHQQIARVLKERFAEIKETQPEALAHHYTEAGLNTQAILYWQQAGQRAIARSANAEAISHLTKGLKLLKTLPDTPERIQQEILLQVNLGLALMATKGFAAPEARDAYARARELCQQVGETPQLFSVLRGLWEFYHVGAELQTARALAEQLLTLAHSVHDSSLLLEAHSTLGMTLMPLGEWATGLKHCEQLHALYNPQRHHAHAFLYGGYDPGVNCLGWAAWCLWGLGYPDQALKRLSEAFTLAQELSHPHSTFYAQGYAALVRQFRREGVLSQERAETVQALAIEYGFPPEWGAILRGWALVEQGQGEEGLVQMRQNLDSYRAIGAKLLRPYFLALIAEAYGKVDQTAEGLMILAEALALVDKTGECWCEAELYRLKGRLTLQKFQVPGSKFQVPPSPQPLTPNTHAEVEAEACFLKAIEIAQRQQAKSWELRATTSLARLWQQQDKKDEARQMLAEIYGWFTEGFDTADLQEAKALLEELNQRETLNQ
jgi:predicted ATPase/class 3 adenylate cyclase